MINAYWENDPCFNNCSYYQYQGSNSKSKKHKARLIPQRISVNIKIFQSLSFDYGLWQNKEKKTNKLDVWMLPIEHQTHYTRQKCPQLTRTFKDEAVSISRSNVHRDIQLCPTNTKSITLYACSEEAYNFCYSNLPMTCMKPSLGKSSFLSEKGIFQNNMRIYVNHHTIFLSFPFYFSCFPDIFTNVSYSLWCLNLLLFKNSIPGLLSALRYFFSPISNRCPYLNWNPSRKSHKSFFSKLLRSTFSSNSLCDKLSRMSTSMSCWQTFIKMHL